MRMIEEAVMDLQGYKVLPSSLLLMQSIVGSCQGHCDWPARTFRVLHIPSGWRSLEGTQAQACRRAWSSGSRLADGSRGQITRDPVDQLARLGSPCSPFSLHQCLVSDQFDADARQLSPQHGGAQLQLLSALPLLSSFIPLLIRGRSSGPRPTPTCQLGSI